MKTRVKFILSDATGSNLYNKGEKGYIDGYITDVKGKPIVIVIVDKRIVFCEPYVLVVVQ